MNERRTVLFLRTRRSPHAISKAPTATTIGANSSFWKTDSKCTVPVAVRIVDMTIRKPVKAMNPPKAIFSRWAAEKVGMLLPYLLLTGLQNNSFAAHPKLMKVKRSFQIVGWCRGQGLNMRRGFMVWSWGLEFQVGNHFVFV